MFVGEKEHAIYVSIGSFQEKEMLIFICFFLRFCAGSTVSKLA